jgi:hypothetical protein
MDDKLADQPARSSERYQVAAATTTTAKRQQLSCSVCRTRKVKVSVGFGRTDHKTTISKYS